VTRHPCTGEGQPDPPAHLDGDHRQGDGDARPAGQDDVEVGVAGVVVAPPVADEAEVIEQVRSQVVETRARAAPGDGIQRSEAGGHDGAGLGRGTGVGGDEQAPGVEPDVGCWPGHHGQELLGR